MRFHQLIYEDYKTAKIKFIQAGAAEEEINKAINDFRKVQNRLSGDQKNIDWWAKQGWEDFQKFVSTKTIEPTKSGLKKKQGDALIIRDDAEWFIVVPLDHEASCYYGSNTDWCTTKMNQDHFSNYFFNNKRILVYAIRHLDNAKWAMAISLSSDITNLFNQRDKHITAQRWRKETGLDAAKLKEEVLSHLNEIEAKREKNKRKDYSFLIAKHLRSRVGRDPILEKLMVLKQDGYNILHYMRKHKIYNWPEGDAALFKASLIDEDLTYEVLYYATSKRPNRWPAFEEFMQPIIGKYKHMTDDYFFYCIKFKVQLSEKLESKLLNYYHFPSKLEYAKNVKGRWPELEAQLLKKANTLTDALHYNFEVLKGKRWPELEKRLLSIRGDFSYGIQYSEGIIKGRWPELEKKMISVPLNSYHAYDLADYARRVIKGRWPEAERAITSYKVSRNRYRGVRY